MKRHILSLKRFKSLLKQLKNIDRTPSKVKEEITIADIMYVVIIFGLLILSLWIFN